MSIFGKIMSAIFGSKAERRRPPAEQLRAAQRGRSARIRGRRAASTVDVAPILDKAVAAKKEKLEWRTSIVDLMKALDIDSSFTRARISRRSSAIPATAMIPRA